MSALCVDPDREYHVTYGKKLVLRTNKNAMTRGMGSESVTSLLCDLGWVEVTRLDHEEFSSNYKLCKNTVSLSGHVTRVVCLGVGIYILKSAGPVLTAALTDGVRSVLASCSAGQINAETA